MVKKNQLIYTINKKQYLLVNFESSVAKESRKKLNEIGAIYQGVKEVKMEGLFSGGYTLLNVLIPTSKIEEFNKLVYSK